MKTPMMNKTCGWLAALVIGSLSMAGAVHAQDRSPDRLNPTIGKFTRPDSSRFLSRKQVQALLDRALPKYDASVLKVGDGRAFTENVNFGKLAQAMNEKPFDGTGEPLGARRLDDQDRTLRMQPEKGKLRYISRARGWSYEKNAKTPAIDPKRAAAVVMGALKTLQFPFEEAAGDPDVQTQMAGGGETDPTGGEGSQIREQFEMYQIVMFNRTMNGLPVFNSKIAAAVANDGQIQRFQAAWPTFHLTPDLRLQERATVLDKATDAILDQQPMSDVEIKAYMAYAPRNKGDKQETFAPAMIISVNSLPTPYQLVVPVAEVPKVDDGPTATTAPR